MRRSLLAKDLTKTCEFIVHSLVSAVCINYTKWGEVGCVCALLGLIWFILFLFFILSEVLQVRLEDRVKQ